MMSSGRFLISVHDVMPSTLAAVEDIIRHLDDAGLVPTTLLVVPGQDWSPDQIKLLRSFCDGGHQLAGHGWTHRAANIKTLYHRAHSLLLSRDVAEHLALTGPAIAGLISDCRAWFDEHDLPAPQLYVPPAWAMGSIDRDRLRSLGFRYFEYLTGIYDSQSARHHRLALLGFEADTRWRALALRMSNRINRLLTPSDGVARLAIHPDDFSLLLQSDLQILIRRGGRAADLASLSV